MSDESREFATEPVPDERTVSWFRVALVSAMVAFSLPTFLTGIEVAAVSSPERAFGMLLVGSIILTLLGSLTGGIGASTRLSSYMLNRIAFGRSGAALVNLAFAVSLLGWFGVNIDLFSGAVVRLAQDMFQLAVPAWTVEVFAGLVMTITAVFGFRAINLLAALLVPVLVLVTYQLIAGSLAATSLDQLMEKSVIEQLSFGDGVSAVVGAIIVGAIILPDITRFIRHWRGAVYAVAISYLVIELIVMCAGGIASTALEDRDLLNIMITLGIGWAAFAIVILGSWVLNSLNLYSTMLSVESTAPALDNKIVVVTLGVLGTVAAFLNILDYFLSFLFYLSIVFVPVSGVIAVDYLLLRKNAYHEMRIEMEQSVRPLAVGAWLFGACVALIASWGWIALTGIAAIDAMLTSALSYFLLMRWMSDREMPLTGKA
ncbi:MAG: cytosine permease [Halioglobus sp.]